MLHGPCTSSGWSLPRLMRVGGNALRGLSGRRILRYVKPTQVHVYVDGRVAATGGPELGEELEAEGYEKYLSAAKANA